MTATRDEVVLAIAREVQRAAVPHHWARGEPPNQLCIETAERVEAALVQLGVRLPGQAGL